MTSTAVMTTPAEPLCPFCLHLLDSDEPCERCGEHYCENCFCPCDHITAEHAYAVALQQLWRDLPTSIQTSLVQDENGATYASVGPGDCFLVIPTYEGECTEGIHLKPEFIQKHERHRGLAIRAEKVEEYATEHYSVRVKPFDIDGRMFTVSVFSLLV